eukprot:CAMPEP_0170321130 /NCGR_PEP_ID=MMETSP0116_2-20130129/61318_1 /TAXON_ID=400756 /ORGANISM="Durinskia baltica, Strain CSIRO CS-38" /LENGTH=175 /DNA_ID=CAMNT_0010573939 /DNA_START=27 /DNA_END=554 /DNA_ORIENTATION=+
MAPRSRFVVCVHAAIFVRRVQRFAAMAKAKRIALEAVAAVAARAAARSSRPPSTRKRALECACEWKEAALPSPARARESRCPLVDVGGRAHHGGTSLELHHGAAVSPLPTGAAVGMDGHGGDRGADGESGSADARREAPPAVATRWRAGDVRRLGAPPIREAAENVNTPRLPDPD